MGNNKITQSVVIQDYNYNGNNHENLILGLPKQTTKQNKKTKKQKVTSGKLNSVLVNSNSSKS